MNIRSLINRDKRIKFANIVNTMQLDFFMVTETWLFDSFADSELFFPNYSLYRSERKAFENVSKHGGVLIAVRNDITSEEIYLAKSVLGLTVACEID